MSFSFSQPLALALLPLLAVTVVFWLRPRTLLGPARRAVSLAVRLLLVLLLVGSLAGTALRLPSGRLAVVFAADRSASAEPSAGFIEDWIRQALAARPKDDPAGVIAFGRSPLVEAPVSDEPRFSRFRERPAADYTDLAAALRLGAALLPPGVGQRIVLLSDGQANLGNALEQAEVLRRQGTIVDVVALPAPSGPEVLVSSVEAPARVHEGAKFPVQVILESAEANAGTLRLYVDNKLQGEQRVALAAGQTGYALRELSLPPGYHSLRVALEPERDRLVQNNEGWAFVNVTGPPSILVVEGQPGDGRNLAAALTATGMKVDMKAPNAFPPSPSELQAYAATVLVDVPAGDLSAGALDRLRSVVRDFGRGLVVVGGSNSFGPGGYRGTPLEEILPVSSQIPAVKDKGRAALVLVIDKSSSMGIGEPNSGTTKMEMAKEAARRAVAELDPDDFAGVLAFDTAFRWVWPVQKVGDGNALKALQNEIARIQADGGTNIFPALETGYRAVAGTDAQLRHVILLTDGQSQSGDYFGLIARMAPQQVSLSTIGIGRDTDQNLLKRMAAEGNGRYYYTERARDIPQIVLKETKIAARNPLVEEPVQPRVAGASPILRAIDSALPALDGHVLTTAKDAAQTLLISPRGDPLLAQWQFGLGRSVAWTSDSQGRWTASFASWPDASKFWSGLVDWVLPPDEDPLRLEVSAVAGLGHLAVETDAPPVTRVETLARITGPAGDARTVRLAASAPGRFEGTFPANDSGAYLIQVTQRDPTGGEQRASGGLVVPYSPEYRAPQPDPQFLARLAQAGGGRVLTQAADAWAPLARPAQSERDLSLTLLLLALFLFPLDIAVRRLTLNWDDLRRSFRRS
jgi:secreted protein with Ig-like and vWFA domain